LSSSARSSRSPADDVTEDVFLGGALSILQPRSGYRAGLDAVLLAAAAPARDGELVLDAGAGVGVVGLAVARRVPLARIVLVERDARLAALAQNNVERNGMAERMRVIEADLAGPLAGAAELHARAESFDHVLANPPFHVEGRGTAATDPVKAGAHAMPAGDLERWARFMASMARPGGTVTMIHRADALASILAAFASRFGGMQVLPIHPRPGEPASRVLVQGVKGSRAPLELRPGLVLHNADNSFRPEVEIILRQGAALNVHDAPSTTS
jgi:tRNA1(Val) A37 N6-methylase TrmN6